MKRIALHKILAAAILAPACLLMSANLFSQETEKDPLYSATIRADTVEVKKALAAGADINRQSSNGYSALMWACSWGSRAGYSDVAKYLINAGADVNIIANDGTTALLEAAECSQEISLMLLEKGAAITACRNDGRGIFTSCIFGILMGKVGIDFAEFLLTSGADINEAATSGEVAGWAAIHYAASNGHTELIQFLIKNGADVNATTKDGKTPLSIATDGGYTAIIKILKAAGAK